jgi:hypothetical protein
MKKLLLIAIAFTLSYAINAQVETPAPSPLSKLEQKVGLTDITVEYSRPGVKDRVIFGDLVPFGKKWRTGANYHTKITSSNDLTIDGKTLKAGTYAIFTKPDAESWDVYFYTDTEGGGVPQDWDDNKVALMTNAKVNSLPFSVESFTIDINNLRNSSATLHMIWDKNYVSIPFEVPTDDAVMASIEKTMNGPEPGDYFQAAVYYYDEGKDINKAVKWIDKAVKMTIDNPRFWVLRQQSLIHAKAGNIEGAIKAAKASLAKAEEAGNDDYIKMNKESLAEWTQ